MKDIFGNVQSSRYFSIQTDETTDIYVQQQCGVMIRFFDNMDGKVRCIFLQTFACRER